MHRGGFGPLRQICYGRDCRSLAKIPVFLQNLEVIKSAANQGLETAPVDFDIFGCVNSELFDVPERFRAPDSQRNNQVLGPFALHLLDQFPTPFSPKIHDHQCRAVLLQNRIDPVGIGDMAQLRHRADECFHSSSDFGIVAI